MGRFDVLANATLVTPVRNAVQVFEHVVPGAYASEDCAAGASRVPNDAGLVSKVLVMEPSRSRRRCGHSGIWSARR
jgi:urease accessory protein